MKYYITIESAHDEWLKVDLEDHNGMRTTIYERNLEQAITYAKNWCAGADQRKNTQDSMNRAIAECIQLDKKAGITSGNRDCLD